MAKGKESKLAAREKRRTEPKFYCPDCKNEINRCIYYPPAGKPKGAFYCEKCDIVFGRKNVIEEGKDAPTNPN